MTLCLSMQEVYYLRYVCQEVSSGGCQTSVGGQASLIVVIVLCLMAHGGCLRRDSKFKRESVLHDINLSSLGVCWVLGAWPRVLVFPVSTRSDN